MTEHDLRCWPEHYAEIEAGTKTVELRLNDRPYQRGDALLLREFEPVKAQTEYEALCAAWQAQPEDLSEVFEDVIDRLREEAQSRAYTGRQLRVRVTHVLSGGVWLAPGYVAMSIRLMGEDGRTRVQEDFRKSYDAEREAHDKTRARADAAEQKGGELATLTQLARDLVASLHGDGNGRCWCGAREADRLRGLLERVDTEEHALPHAALRAAAAAITALAYTEDTVVVGRAEFERLKGAIDE